MDDEDLQPDGNCLGVALLDAWRLAGVEPPAIPLADLTTTKEAIAALSLVRRPRLLIRPGARFLEKMTQHRLGRRLHLATTAPDAVLKDETLLCLRSIRQLYGLPYSAGHWVVIRDGQIYDQLKPQIEESFPGVKQVLPEKVLSSFGLTLVL